MTNPTGWKLAGTLPTALYATDALTFNGYLYVAGGISAGGVNRNIQTGLSGGDTLAAAYSAGHLTLTLAGGVWATTPTVGDIFQIPYGSAVAGAANANVGSYIVTASSTTTVVGTPVLASQAPVAVTATTITGNDVQDFSAPTTSSSILVAPIAASGTIGSFTVAGNMPAGRSFTNLIRIGTNLLALGGLDNNLNPQGQIWVWSIGGNGTLTYQASKSTGFFNPGVGAVAATIMNNQIWIEGANNTSSGTFLQVATINSDDTIGAFKIYAGPTTSSKGLVGAQMVALPTFSTLVVHGGLDASGATPNTYAAMSSLLVSSNNTNTLNAIVPWKTFGSTPTLLAYQGLAHLNGRNIMWVVGGTTTGANAGSVSNVVAYDLNTLNASSTLLPAPINCSALPLALSNLSLALDNRGILLSVGGIGTTNTITNSVYVALPQGNGAF